MKCDTKQCEREATYPCGRCGRKQCDECRTGDTCQRCEKNVCCLKMCEEGLASDPKGKYIYCWDCIFEAMTLLEKADEAESKK